MTAVAGRAPAGRQIRRQRRFVHVADAAVGHHLGAAAGNRARHAFRPDRDGRLRLALGLQGDSRAGERGNAKERRDVAHNPSSDIVACDRRMHRRRGTPTWSHRHGERRADPECRLIEVTVPIRNGLEVAALVPARTGVVGHVAARRHRRHREHVAVQFGELRQLGRIDHDAAPEIAAVSLHRLPGAKQAARPVLGDLRARGLLDARRLRLRGRGRCPRNGFRSGSGCGPRRA